MGDLYHPSLFLNQSLTRVPDAFRNRRLRIMIDFKTLWMNYPEADKTVEEQRVENADFIMSITAGSFAIVAILTGLVVYGLVSLKKMEG